MTRVFDINCDMGEGYGNWSAGDDAAVRPWITTANIACGFHAGDPLTIINAIDAALERGIAVGAHPGLPDLLGFGRRVMAITPEDAYAYVLYQAGALAGMLTARGGTLHHIKPHGAFHYLMNDSHEICDAVLQAVEHLMPEPLIYWPAGRDDAPVVRIARDRGISIVFEFYPDLGYRADGTLVVERHKRGGDSADAAARVRRLLEDGTVETADGGTLTVEVGSICIHGDSPSAAQIAEEVAKVVREFGHTLQAAGDPKADGARM